MQTRVTLAGFAGCLALLSLAPAALAQSADAGQRTFELRCARCHGADGRGGEMGPALPPRLATLDDETLAKTIHDGIPAKGMPPNVLPAAESGTLVAYLRVLERRAAERPLVRMSVQTASGAAL